MKIRFNCRGEIVAENEILKRGYRPAEKIYDGAEQIP
jgi:hypothetical protein